MIDIFAFGMLNRVTLLLVNLFIFYENLKFKTKNVLFFLDIANAHEGIVRSAKWIQAPSNAVALPTLVSVGDDLAVRIWQVNQILYYAALNNFVFLDIVARSKLQTTLSFGSKCLFFSS